MNVLQNLNSVYIMSIALFTNTNINTKKTIKYELNKHQKSALDKYENKTLQHIN